MTPDEEAAYVREVASQKTAALRMSLDAADRQRMPFVGESGGLGFGGRASGDAARDGQPAAEGASMTGAGAGTPDPAVAGASIDRAPDRAGLPLEPGLAERLAEARRRAEEHLDHDAPRAPRPERMQR